MIKKWLLNEEYLLKGSGLVGKQQECPIVPTLCRMECWAVNGGCQLWLDLPIVPGKPVLALSKR